MAERLLNEQEAAFVRALLGEARGQRGRAAVLAGYSEKGAAVQANRLLNRVHVQQAIRRAQERRLKAAIATNDEIDATLSLLLRHKSPVVRVMAARELNKVRGRHSTRHIHEGSITLEDAVAASRREKVVNGKVVDDGQKALPAGAGRDGAAVPDAGHGDLHSGDRAR
jgi:phage terminase small subunit